MINAFDNTIHGQIDREYKENAPWLNETTEYVPDYMEYAIARGNMFITSTESLTHYYKAHLRNMYRRKHKMDKEIQEEYQQRLVDN